MKLYTLQNKFIKEVIDPPSDFTGISEYIDGSKYWFLKGKYHRLDGPACEWSDGTKIWYVEGKRHRLDGPAYENCDGTKVWFVEGKRHRLDGPACEWKNGTKEWWVDDKRITEEQCRLLYSIMKLKGLI